MVSGCSHPKSKSVHPLKSIAVLKGALRDFLCAAFVNLTGAQNVAGTSDERRCKNVRGFADEATFPSDTDRCQGVIAGDHPTNQMGRS